MFCNKLFGKALKQKRKKASPKVVNCKTNERKHNPSSKKIRRTRQISKNVV